MKITDKNAVFKLTDNGYLVTEATLSRVGTMDYFGEEIGAEKGKVYQVEVTDDELFKPEVISSFEGMPVTLLHPDGLEVNAENWKEFAIGHVQNVRREGDFLKGEAFVTDAAAIRVIQDYGIKELSCGYDAEIINVKDKFKKTQIVGNHVAIVPSGRAGSVCRLGDEEKTMKNRKTFADSLKKLLGMSKKLGDAELTPEEKAALESAIAEMQVALDALPEDAAPETVDELKAKIAELQAKLDARATVDTTTADADPKDEEIASLKARIAELETENAALKDEQARSGAVADAQARFPAVKVGDAKNARAVYMNVLADAKAFNDAEMKTMSDAEIKSAYMALRTVQSQSKPTVGKKLFGDAKSDKKVDLTAKFGGKK